MSQLQSLRLTLSVVLGTKVKLLMTGRARMGCRENCSTAADFNRWAGHLEHHSNEGCGCITIGSCRTKTGCGKSSSGLRLCQRSFRKRYQPFFHAVKA